MKYLRWVLLLIPSIVVGLLARLLAPFVCLFVVREARFDTVKRLGKQRVLLQRDDLMGWLAWFKTDDNDVSEYWYGIYPLTRYFTQAQYDACSVLRWFMRVCWLWRNSAYTFNRKFFGLPKDSALAWQYKAQLPLWLGYYNDINIGYKAHKGLSRLLYAGRIIGIRKK